MNVTSPDISVLDFSVLYDISTPVPTITFTNQSSGPNLAGCTWWVSLYTPSNTPVHVGNSTTPDKTGNWTTYQLPEAWPQPFNQVEFSNTNPYLATVNVKDSQGNIFSLTKETIICRPLGNTTASIGNFGNADMMVDVRCQDATVYVEDDTAYGYQGLGPTLVARDFILAYPADSSGTVPAPVTVSGLTNALFDITQNSGLYPDTPDYTMYLNATMLYTFSNGTKVQIKYKSMQRFSVWCNVDLAPLICEIQQMYDQLNGENCGNYQSPDLQNKLLTINGLLLQAIIGKMQPLSGVNVPDIINQIKEIGGFTCNCISGGTGVNGSSGSAISIGAGTMCGDISLNITKTGNNYTFNLSDVSYVFALCQGIPTDAFSISSSLDQNTCTKTYCLNVDLTKLKNSLGFVAPVVVPIQIHTTHTTPTECPGALNYPRNVYDPTDATVIGLAHNIDEIISIINGNTLWQAIGTAFNAGNCAVGILPVNATVTVEDVRISADVVTDTGCVGSIRTYDITLLDYCAGTNINILSYPFRGYVQYTPSGTKYDIGLITTYAALLAALTAEANKPAQISYSSAPTGATNGDVNVQIDDTNCTAGGYQVTIYAETGEYISYGANNNMNTPASYAGIYGQDELIEANIGQFCGITDSTAMPWHIRRSPSNQNHLYYMETNTGLLYKYDISNPLYPVKLLTVSIPTTVAAGSPPNVPFSGLPKYNGTVFSHWDVYLGPTDANSAIDGAYMHIFESASGCIWKYDTTTDTVITSFYDLKLVGKCPRVITIGTNTNFLYFSHDGLRETQLGISSGVPRDAIIYLDLSTYSSAGLNVVTTVAPSGDECWAASMDISGILWFTTIKGALVRYDPQLNTVLNTYPAIYGVDFTGSILINSTMAAVGKQTSGITTMKIFASSDNKGTWFVDLGSTPVSLGQFTPSTDISLIHRNFTIIPGNCYGIVTYDKGDQGGIAKYDYFGNYIGHVQLTAGSMYNALVFKLTGASSPNGLCP